eukprot:s309_g9.t1
MRHVTACRARCESTVRWGGQRPRWLGAASKHDGTEEDRVPAHARETQGPWPCSQLSLPGTAPREIFAEHEKSKASELSQVLQQLHQRKALEEPKRQPFSRADNNEEDLSKMSFHSLHQELLQLSSRGSDATSLSASQCSRMADLGRQLEVRSYDLRFDQLLEALVAVGTAAAHVEGMKGSISAMRYRPPHRARALAAEASAFAGPSPPSLARRELGAMSSVGLAVLVTVEIKPDRIDEFLKVMEGDAKGSRDKALDPGCLRFDLLRDRDNPNKFVFYEAYVDDGAIGTHKTTAHYKAWADFKATGAVESQTVVKGETASLPAWAFQTLPTGTKTSAAVLVTVDVKAEKIDDFLKVMEGDAVNARDKAQEPNCLRFDLLKDKEVANRYHFYEVYLDDAAVDHHRTTAHYKGWAEFKAAGGVEKQSVMKLETASIPGEWALQL